jgi:hypothetical protein
MASIELDALITLERKVWDALAAGDAMADERLLSDDFLGVYPTGFAGRGDHAGALADGPTVESYAIEEARAMHLGDEVALLAYRAVYHRPGEPTEHEMYITSVWQRRAGAWVNVFSQDTPSGAAWAAV